MAALLRDPLGPATDFVDALRAALLPTAASAEHPALRDHHSLEARGRYFHVEWLTSLDSWTDAERTRANIEDSYNDTFTAFAVGGADVREANRLRKLYLLLSRT